MGFQLWMDGDLAWAKGTYEYRPMGVAVISACDLFHPRDFHPRRRVPPAARPVGQFASIGHLNSHLRLQRRAPVKAASGKVKA